MPNFISLRHQVQKVFSLLKNQSYKQYIVLLFSQGLNFAAALFNNILLTKLMSESDFGSYKYGHNFLNLVGIIALFGLPYSASRLLAKTTSSIDERKIIGVTIQKMAAISIICSLFILCTLIIVISIGIKINLILFYCIPSIILMVLQQSQLAMLQGTGKVKGISIQTFVPSVFLLLTLLVCFGIGIKTLSLAYVWLIFCLGYLSAQFITFQITQPIFSRHEHEIKHALMEEYRANGKGVYFGSLLGVASTYCVNFILGTISDMAEYAVYALAWSLAAVLQMVPSVMGTVMFRTNAAAVRISHRNMIFTITVSGCAYFAFVLLLQVLIPILFPASYLDAKWMGAILGFAMILNGIGDFFNRFISANGHGNYIRNGAFITGLVNIFFSIVLLGTLKITGIIIARILASTAYLCMMIFYYIRVLKEKEGIGSNEAER